MWRLRTGGGGEAAPLRRHSHHRQHCHTLPVIPAPVRSNQTRIKSSITDLTPDCWPTLSHIFQMKNYPKVKIFLDWRLFIPCNTAHYIGHGSCNWPCYWLVVTDSGHRRDKIAIGTTHRHNLIPSIPSVIFWVSLCTRLFTIVPRIVLRQDNIELWVCSV